MKFVKFNRDVLYLFICFLVLQILLSCTDRSRDNPFDPKSDQPPPVSLDLLPDSESVRLEWQLNSEFTKLSGFRIYRSVGAPDNFQLFKELPSTQTTYTDTSVEKGTWYYYRITALGESVESPPSKNCKTLLGEGEYWVLGRNDFGVRKISYDLIHELSRFSTFYSPEEWAICHNDSSIWLSFATFTTGLSRLNKISGSEEIFYLNEFEYPIDIEQTPNTNKLYVLDDDRKKVFVLHNNNIVNQIAIDSSDSYSKIKYDTINDQLLVLGQRKLLMIALNGNERDIYPFSTDAGQLGVDFDLVGLKAYLISTDIDEEKSILHVLSQNPNRAANFTLEDSLHLDGIFYRIRFDHVNDWYYVAKRLNSANDFILQLSLDGNRLSQLSGFNFVEQIEINPHDRTVIVVDGPGNILYLYGKDGQLISKALNEDGDKYIGRPIRVFIE